MRLDELLVFAQNKTNNEEDSHALFWLLLEVFELTNTSYLINKDLEVNVLEENKYLSLVDKYLTKQIPVQYLIGHSYFYGKKFIVNENTLIPRPETEELIFKTINYINEFFKNKKELKILDLATGSGCIGITLKHELPNSLVTVSDISSNTLDVTNQNIKLHELDINVVNSNWFENISGKFDVIISNPPYIPTEYKVGDKVLKEPNIALYSGLDGADSYREILSSINNYLNDDAIVAFEHGYDQNEIIHNIIKNNIDDVIISQEKDLSNKDRFTFIFKRKKD